MQENGARFIGQDPNLNSEILAHDREQMVPLFKENFYAWLPRDSGAAILDFGCGYGTFLRYLESIGFTNAVGFDPDPRCVKFCVTHGKSLVESGDHFSYLSGRTNIQLLSVQTVLNYFDRQDLGALFRHFHSALAPGGILLIDVPNAAGVTGLMEFIQDPYMKSFYTDVLLKDLAQQAGFKVEHIGGLRLPKKGLKRAIWQLGQRLWQRAIKLIYLIEKGYSERIPKEFGARLILVARRVD